MHREQTKKSIAEAQRLLSEGAISKAEANRRITAALEYMLYHDSLLRARASRTVDPGPESMAA